MCACPVLVIGIKRLIVAAGRRDYVYTHTIFRLYFHIFSLLNGYDVLRELWKIELLKHEIGFVKGTVSRVYSC